jgi:hypothetical protein
MSSIIYTFIENNYENIRTPRTGHASDMVQTAVSKV